MGPTVVVRKKSKAVRKPGVELTPKQAVFVSEYIKDFNGTRAAQVAGFKSPENRASEMLVHPVVSKEIAKAVDARLKKNELTAERVLRELTYIALRDPIELCNERGQIIVNSLKDVPEQMRRCIDGIKCKQYTHPDGTIVQEIELKLVGKLGAIELAAKHLGLITEKKQIDIRGKVQLDYDKLCQVPPKKMIELDPVEYRISNPTESPPNQDEKVQYSVAELIDDEDGS